VIENNKVTKAEGVLRDLGIRVGMTKAEALKVPGVLEALTYVPSESGDR
jgi:hypothetical protein